MNQTNRIERTKHLKSERNCSDFRHSVILQPDDNGNIQNPNVQISDVHYIPIQIKAFLLQQGGGGVLEEGVDQIPFHQCFLSCVLALSFKFSDVIHGCPLATLAF